MRRRRKKDRSERGATATSNQRLLEPSISITPSRSYLQEIEDRREFHPERADRPALSLFGRPHRLTEHKVVHRRARPVLLKRSSMPPQPIGFVNPQQVVVCVRRKQRKEVLFALGKTGRGARRKPRRTWRSEISCGGKNV